jgi:hypothetical protein
VSHFTYLVGKGKYLTHPVHPLSAAKPQMAPVVSVLPVVEQQQEAALTGF